MRRRSSLVVWIVTLGVGESVTKDVSKYTSAVTNTTSNKLLMPHFSRTLRRAVEQSRDLAFRNIVILRVKQLGVRLYISSVVTFRRINGLIVDFKSGTVYIIPSSMQYEQRSALLLSLSTSTSVTTSQYTETQSVVFRFVTHFTHLLYFR